MLIGIHGDNRPTWPESAWHKLEIMQPQLVKMLTWNNLVEFERLKETLPNAAVITRIFWPGKPPPFEEWMCSPLWAWEDSRTLGQQIHNIIDLGYNTFELLNEPNLPHEGWGPNDASGFDEWALEVIPLLRQRFPSIKLLWPAMGYDLELSDAWWWEKCEKSIRACDGLAAHAYWQPPEEMYTWRWGRRHRLLRDMYPGIPIYITEAGNTFPEASGVTKAEKADQYVHYCKQLELDGIKGVAFWLLEGSREAPDWEAEQNCFFDEGMAEKLGSYIRSENNPGQERRQHMGWVTRLSEFNSTYPQRPLSGINYIVIHHSGFDVDSTAESIRAYHESLKGSSGNPWPGIGYHFLVHWDGLVEYVGDIRTLRYNVSGRNQEVIGICIPGDWSLRTPPGVALQALPPLIEAIWELLGRTVPVVGHRDLAATICPGDTWNLWKEVIKPVTPSVGDVMKKQKERVLALYGHMWGRAEDIIRWTRSKRVREAAQTIKDCIIQAKEAQGWP